jgi:hypothetical protein
MASWGGELRLWRPGHCPTSARDVAQVRPTAVAFDGRGRLLALEPGTLRRFSLPEGSDPDPDTGRVLTDLDPLPLPEGPGPAPRSKASPTPVAPMAIARSTDGRVLALARRSEVLLYRLGDPDSLALLAAPPAEVPAGARSRPGPSVRLVARPGGVPGRRPPLPGQPRRGVRRLVPGRRRPPAAWPGRSPPP